VKRKSHGVRLFDDHMWRRYGEQSCCVQFFHGVGLVSSQGVGVTDYFHDVNLVLGHKKHHYSL
jgi:hypothetical protein